MVKDKSVMKEAMTVFLIGIGVSAGLGIASGIIFALFEGWHFVIFLSGFIMCYGAFAGWTLIYALQLLFCKSEYILKYSAMAIYYGGLGIAWVLNTRFPEKNIFVHMLIGIGVAVVINFIVTDVVVNKKEKERKEKEALHQAFEKGKEEGFEEGYRRGYAEKETNCDEEKAIIRAYDFIIKRIQPDGKFIDSETGLVYDTKNPYEIEEIVDVIAHRRLTYQSVLKTILSKTQPDGIYIDPETKEKFDMNSPYDRADIVTATMSEIRLKNKATNKNRNFVVKKEHF